MVGGNLREQQTVGLGVPRICEKGYESTVLRESREGGYGLEFSSESFDGLFSV